MPKRIDINLIILIVALLSCIAAYLALPQIQKVLSPQATLTQVSVSAINPPVATNTSYPTQVLLQPTDTPLPTYTAQPTLAETPTSSPSPTLTPIADTSLGTVLRVEDTWISNGVSLTLERVTWEPDVAWIGQVDFWLYLKNNTDQEILISFDEHTFDVRDNLGKIYLPKCLYQSPYEYVIASGKGKYLADSCTPYDSTMFTGDFFNQSVEQLTITIKNLSRVQEAQWVVDVPH
jgi:hypothetical protein